MKWLSAVLATTILSAGMLMSDPSPAPAQTRSGDPRSVSIFYYPWYGVPERDEAWRHWEQSGVTPPESIGANFYPVRGTYSSSSPVVVDAHMHEIAAAGIDTAVISWWGRGSYEDSVIALSIDAARRNQLNPAAHLEPYEGRTPATVADDLSRLHSLGIREVYLYNAMNMSSTGMRNVLSRFSDITFWVQSGGYDARSGALASWAASAGADGIYTYDPYGVQPSDFVDICASAHSRKLRCAPSVGPGWDGTRATRFTFVKDRRGGLTYDEYWSAALAAKADVVSITSYNEWHEGTTIEPARERACLPDNFCYQDYGGAYGWNGPAAGWSYMNRTRHWVNQAKGREPDLGERLDVAGGAIRVGDAATFESIASHPALAGFAR